MKALSYSEQRAIISRCIKNDLHLGDELRRLGCEYESLRYEYNAATRGVQPNFIKFEALPRLSPRIPLVSFFSGCGGLDLGFEAAGFEHLTLVDNNELACTTLRSNRPTWNVLGPPDCDGDVSQREAVRSSLIRLGIKSPFEGIFVGGPPCQPFSIAANQRFSKNGRNFKRIGFLDLARGNLLFDFIWFIKELRPTAFLVENVPGLLAIDRGEQMVQAIRELTECGYFVTGPQLIEASNYGVPAQRQRLFIIGCRHNRLLLLPQGNGKKVPCGAVLSPSLNGVQNHVTREHSASSIARYMLLKYGERDHLGRVDRLDPNLPSKTVIAGGTRGGGRSHLHPVIPRTLSVRECARLQTFPDWYVFYGAVARQFTQVGNAVPPKLAYEMATAIAKFYF